MRFRNLSHTTDELFRLYLMAIGKRNLIYAYWWGVNISFDNSFMGKCYFRRYPKSSIEIGRNCMFLSRKNSNLIGINRPCMISTLSETARINIGDNCGFSGTVIGAFTNIEIGNNVRCGANTLITDSDWHLEDDRLGGAKPVYIGENAWIGLNVVVLKGSRIGRNSIIGANSVVVGEIPPNVIAAGNPCKVIRDIEYPMQADGKI